MLQHMANVELLRVCHRDVFQILGRELEVFVPLERRQEHQPIDAKGLDNLTEELCPAVLKLLRIDDNDAVLIQLCTEHDL